MPDATGAYRLTYCTNVLPGESLQEMKAALLQTASPLRERRGADLLPLGLWWSAETVRSLSEGDAIHHFADWLGDHGFSAATLNCFPYGGFHAPQVKREVFRPGWHEPARRDYTVQAARLLAGLLAEGESTAISTLSGTHKAWHAPGVEDAVARGLVHTAVELARLAEDSGVEIVLAIEPEPFSTLETTDEVLAFFEQRVHGEVGTQELRRLGADGPRGEAMLRRHLGLCYDTCHQAVEFESPVASLRALQAAGIRIGKVQLSSAPALQHPAAHPEALEVLRRYVEPRYLHQTFVRDRDGEVRGWQDLAEFFADPPDLDEVDEIRTHFHVPIDREVLCSSAAEGSNLQTTQKELRAALGEVVRLGSCALLEVETYTFDVFPSGAGLGPSSGELVDGLVAELEAAERFLGDSIAESAQ